MSDAEKNSVKTGAVLLDPASMAVLWSNDIPEGSAATGDRQSTVSLDDVVPMARQLGLHETVAEVAATGRPAHRQADVVSMSRGSVAYVVSVYRLPDGMVLILTEHAWQVTERASHESSSRTARRRTR